jgi:Zn-dependent peptidase ImmA (M78 family)
MRILSPQNQIKAAKLLNISRDALRYKMKKFGLAHGEEAIAIRERIREIPRTNSGTKRSMNKAQPRRRPLQFMTVVTCIPPESRDFG